MKRAKNHRTQLRGRHRRLLALGVMLSFFLCSVSWAEDFWARMESLESKVNTLVANPASPTAQACLTELYALEKKMHPEDAEERFDRQRAIKKIHITLRNIPSLQPVYIKALPATRLEAYVETMALQSSVGNLTQKGAVMIGQGVIKRITAELALYSQDIGSALRQMGQGKILSALYEGVLTDSAWKEMGANRREAKGHVGPKKGEPFRLNFQTQGITILDGEKKPLRHLSIGLIVDAIQYSDVQKHSKRITQILTGLEGVLTHHFPRQTLALIEFLESKGFRAAVLTPLKAKATQQNIRMTRTTPFNDKELGAMASVLTLLHKQDAGILEQLARQGSIERCHLCRGEFKGAERVKRSKHNHMAVHTSCFNEKEMVTEENKKRYQTSLSVPKKIATVSGWVDFLNKLSQKDDVLLSISGLVTLFKTIREGANTQLLKQKSLWEEIKGAITASSLRVAYTLSDLNRLIVDPRFRLNEWMLSVALVFVDDPQFSLSRIQKGLDYLVKNYPNISQLNGERLQVELIHLAGMWTAPSINTHHMSRLLYFLQEQYKKESESVRHSVKSVATTLVERMMTTGFQDAVFLFIEHGFKYFTASGQALASFVLSEASLYTHGMEKIMDLVEKGFRNTDKRVRQNALKALANLLAVTRHSFSESERNMILNIVEVVLSTPMLDNEVKGSAATVLANIVPWVRNKDERVRVMEFIQQVLHAEGNTFDVRANTAQALENLSSVLKDNHERGALLRLIRVVLRDDDHRVRKHGTWAMARIAGTAIDSRVRNDILDLAEVALEDTDSDVRYDVIHTLNNIIRNVLRLHKKEERLKFLELIQKGTRDTTLLNKRYAYSILAIFSEESWRSEVESHKILACIEPALMNKAADESLREDAAKSLTHISSTASKTGKAKKILALIERVSSAESTSIQIEAAMALRKMEMKSLTKEGRGKVLEVVKVGIKNRAADIRMNSIRTLESLSGKLTSEEELKKASKIIDFGMKEATSDERAIYESIQRQLEENRTSLLDAAKSAAKDLLKGMSAGKKGKKGEGDVFNEVSKKLKEELDRTGEAPKGKKKRGKKKRRGK